MGEYQKPTGSLIGYMSNQVKTRGGINLAQGIPGFQPPRELLQELSNTAFEPVHQYAPGIGNLDLFNQLLERYQHFSTFSSDNLLITNGATEAVSLIYAYFNHILKKPYGVLGFEPAYESYRKLPGIFHDHFISFPYETDGSVNFQNLWSTCRKQEVRIIFLNTPGNPYGRIWKEQEIEQLTRLCLEEGIYLVVDSVYQELYFHDEPVHPIRYFNERMFYVNSFSKIFSITGWRIGYMIVPEHHIKAIRSIHDYTGLCVPSILQEALVRYISKNDWGRQYIHNLREQLSHQFNMLKTGLEALGFSVPHIEGGFFVWARLPEGWTDGFQVAMDLYEQQKVAVIPGEHFSERHRNYIRLNIARERKEVDQGISRMARYFNDQP